MELSVRSAEGNTLFTSPNVGGVVRIVRLHIRPRGDFRKVHLGAALHLIKGGNQLTAGGRLLLFLVVQRCRKVHTFLYGYVSIREPLDTLKLQILVRQKNAAVLRGKTHHRGNESLIRLAGVTVVAPRLNDVLLGRIQRVRGNLEIDESEASLQARLVFIITVDVTLHLAHNQDGGTRALLANDVHHALNAGDVSPYEALTLNQQLLILRGVLQSVVFQLRCEGIEVIIIGAQTVMRHNVLASPDILNG